MSEFEFSYKTAIETDLLHSDGPLIEVRLTAPMPLVSFLADNDFPPYAIASGFALIDTGAAVSVVDESVMEELAIPHIDTTSIHTVHGVAELRRYNSSASFPGLQLQDVPLMLAPAGSIRTETTTGPDIVMLIGRDLLQKFVLTYDGPGAKITVRT